MSPAPPRNPSDPAQRSFPVLGLKPRIRTDRCPEWAAGLVALWETGMASAFPPCSPCSCT